MSSPSRCTRCSEPLAVESASGLCLACLSALESPRPTPTRAGSPFPTAGEETASFRNVAPNASPAGALLLGETATAGPAARTSMPPAPPGYELLSKLGSGGMGDVYLARDLTADRVVAVKFLRAAHNPEAIERFLREVQALARVSHPNIVRVLGYDFYRVAPFFTMDYAAGGTLGQRVARDGPLPPTEAARLAGVVARAVHAAHEAGVIHRDLKPSNVLLAEDGTPRVSDFGLAKRTDREDAGVTASGPLGTPHYMPPEQVSRDRGEMDRRSDVYGLGATLYHLLTGRPPFNGPEPELYARLLGTPPERPGRLRPGVPPGLEGIVLKCLEKRPGDRYPTAAALADDLDRFLAGLRPDAPPMNRRRRTRRWVVRNRVALAAAGLAVLAAVGLGAAVRRTPTPSGSVPGRDSEPPPWPVPVPDPSPEVVRKIQGEVARGPAPLVGTDGLPRWYWWRLGSGAGGSFTPGAPGAAFAVSARAECLLELLPDPGIDRYRITAVVRHERVVGKALPREGDLPRVGLYFGHDQKAGPRGVRVHAAGVVGFSDYGPVPPDPDHPQRIHCWDDLLFDGPFAVPTFHKPRGVAPLEAVPDLPGPWRTIEIDVAPDRVVVSIDGRAFAHYDIETLRERDETLQSETNARFPDGRVRLSGWNPRAPFGLWVYAAQIGVQSVTLTPPRPNP